METIRTVMLAIIIVLICLGLFKECYNPPKKLFWDVDNITRNLDELERSIE